MAEIRKQHNSDDEAVPAISEEADDGEPQLGCGAQHVCLSARDAPKLLAAHAEIVQTEERYVRTLRTLVVDYIPVLADVMDGEPQLAVLGHCTMLLGVNERLLGELHASVGCGCLAARSEAIAEAFTLLRPFLKAYAAFCAGYFGALERLAAMRAEQPLFDAELKAVEARLHAAASGAGGATADVSLSSCLIAPVKRLCLYPLMIDAVVSAQQRAAQQLQQRQLQEQRNGRPRRSAEPHESTPLRLRDFRRRSSPFASARGSSPLSAPDTNDCGAAAADPVTPNTADTTCAAPVLGSPPLSPWRPAPVEPPDTPSSHAPSTASASAVPPSGVPPSASAAAAKESQSLAPLLHAAAEMKQMAEEVNSRVREAESRVRMMEVYARIGHAAAAGLIAPNIRFVAELDLPVCKLGAGRRSLEELRAKAVSSKLCRLWLLSDRLLVARPDRGWSASGQFYHLKDNVPLNELEVIADEAVTAAASAALNRAYGRNENVASGAALLLHGPMCSLLALFPSEAEAHEMHDMIGRAVAEHAAALHSRIVPSPSTLEMGPPARGMVSFGLGLRARSLGRRSRNSQNSSSRNSSWKRSSRTTGPAASHSFGLSWARGRSFGARRRGPAAASAADPRAKSFPVQGSQLDLDAGISASKSLNPLRRWAGGGRRATGDGDSLAPAATEAPAAERTPAPKQLAAVTTPGVDAPASEPAVEHPSGRRGRRTLGRPSKRVSLPPSGAAEATSATPPRPARIPAAPLTCPGPGPRTPSVRSRIDAAAEAHTPSSDPGPRGGDADGNCSPLSGAAWRAGGVWDSKQSLLSVEAQSEALAHVMALRRERSHLPPAHRKLSMALLTPSRKLSVPAPPLSAHKAPRQSAPSTPAGGVAAFGHSRRTLPGLPPARTPTASTHAALRDNSPNTPPDASFTAATPAAAPTAAPDTVAAPPPGAAPTALPVRLLGSPSLPETGDGLAAQLHATRARHTASRAAAQVRPRRVQLRCCGPRRHPDLSALDSSSPPGCRTQDHREFLEEGLAKNGMSQVRGRPAVPAPSLTQYHIFAGSAGDG